MPASYPFPYRLLSSHVQRTSSSVLLPSVSATKLLLLFRSPSVSTRLFSSLSKRSLASFSRSTFCRHQFSPPFLLSLSKSSQVKYRLLHGRLERLGRPQLTQPQLRPIT